MKINMKKSVSSLYGPLIRLIVILPVIYVILYPLFTMITTSLQDQYQILDPSVVWVPKSISLVNYKTAIQALDYFKALWQTFKVNIISALMEVAVCAVTAYGFARFNFKFKKLFIAILVFHIIIPPEMISVPTYLQLRYYDVLGILNLAGKIIGNDIRPNLIDTPFSFWIPSLLSVGLRSGLFIFIYMQFYKGLPKELEEAAYIDGAGPFKTFIKIIVPSSGVACLTVLIFSVIWHWNEYFLSSLYFTNNFPLAVRLSQIGTTLNVMGAVNSLTSYNGIIMAASLLFILPMLIMYMLLQRKFVKSVDRVGIVG